MNIKALIGGTVFGLFGFYMLKSSLKSLHQYKSSLNWSKTQGEILKSEAVRFKSTSGHTSYFVNYEYFVDNQR